MSKFQQDDKVRVSYTCIENEYRGISGTVLEVYPWSDGQKNRVCLDMPVNNACIFWFTDDELILQHAQELSNVEKDAIEVLKMLDF